MDALRLIAIVSLVVSAMSAIIVLLDIATGHRQKMAVMNWVWPVTAIYAGPLGLGAYWKFGRAHAASSDGKMKPPFWQSVLVGDTHCGAGCTIGDFAAEWIVFLAGLRIAGSALFASFALDFALAYLVGIIFQYFAIAPMRGISGWAGIQAAVKADTISLIAFEIGMFIWMAASRSMFHPALTPSEPAYWLNMQIAMLIGFGTAFPANWWLIRKGLKEAM